MSDTDVAKRNSLALRNRRNAVKSTGPRTPEGKAIARRNAIKHGLTAADPTALGPEEGALFKQMHEQLVEELAPRGVIEDSLVHGSPSASGGCGGQR